MLRLTRISNFHNNLILGKTNFLSKFCKFFNEIYNVFLINVFPTSHTLQALGNIREIHLGICR